MDTLDLEEKARELITAFSGMTEASNNQQLTLPIAEIGWRGTPGNLDDIVRLADGAVESGQRELEYKLAIDKNPQGIPVSITLRNTQGRDLSYFPTVAKEAVSQIQDVATELFSGRKGPITER